MFVGAARVEARDDGGDTTGIEIAGDGDKVGGEAGSGSGSGGGG